MPSKSTGRLGFLGFLATSLIVPGVFGHVAAWHKGMYCLNGTTPGLSNENNNEPVQPLWQLPMREWWMHHMDKCDEFPPNEGDFLEIPSGKSFTVELAVNRAFTTLSYDGRETGVFPDGQDHPNLGFNLTEKSAEGCITAFNIHAQNETMAAGTAFAISYTSDITQVTPENLVVFSVLYNTPWKRIAEYRVPEMPACPDKGCHCAWGWVPNGCGMPNMYMQPFKCMVTGQTGSKAIAPAKPPVWCEGNPSDCVQGPKQMVFWNQLEGNNVVVDGYDSVGQPRSPGYNAKMGFSNGAQTDIFLDHDTATPTYVGPPSSTPTIPLQVDPITDAPNNGGSVVTAPLLWTLVITCGVTQLIVKYTFVFI